MESTLRGRGGKKKKKLGLFLTKEKVLWRRNRKKKGKTDNAPYVTLSAGPVFQHVKIIRAAVTHYIS